MSYSCLPTIVQRFLSSGVCCQEHHRIHFKIVSHAFNLFQRISLKFLGPGRIRSVRNVEARGHSWERNVLFREACFRLQPLPSAMLALARAAAESRSADP